jgi:hypothetical protein
MAFHFGDLAKMQRWHFGVDGAGGQINRDAVFTNGFDVIGPLIDEGYIKAPCAPVPRNAMRGPVASFQLMI